MKRMLFIMNPCSGTKKANKYLTEILSIFNRAGYAVQVYITEKRGDATEMAKQAKDVDVVVCCGGDGTFNETLTGLLEAGLDIPMGYIPAGSTNDFASSLKLPTEVVAAAKNIARGKPMAFDAGLFEDRYFSYVASFGAFTKTSYNTPQSIKNALGHAAYVLGGIYELSQIRSISAMIDLDGEIIKGKYIFGAICNSTSVGGVLNLDPKQVDMSDGKFEVLLVRAPKSLSELTECIQAFQNKTYNCRMVSFRSASRVRVTMRDPVDWSLDGELHKGLHTAHITNQHLAYRLLTTGDKR